MTLTSAPAKPARIGIDARLFRSATGGIGRYSQELIRHLAAIDHTNCYRVYLTRADRAEWDIDQANFTPVVVGAGHYSIAEQTQLLKVLNADNLDLVHFLNFNHPVRYQRPFVTTCLDFTMLLFPHGRSQTAFPARQAFIYTLHDALRRAARVIAISQHTAEDAMRHAGIARDKIEVIHLGGPAPDAVRVAPHRVHEWLGTADPYFLFVSHWRLHKGMLALIEAFARFKADTRLPHRLVLLGNPKMLESEISAALATCPYRAAILTPGFIPGEWLPGLYQQCAGFICPSRYEGFGLPVLEAFSHGAPAIVANNSALPEVAGEAALYFPTDDRAALAARMSELVGKPALAEQVRRKGREQLAKFSWDTTARRTLAVYQDVLKQAPH